jgi:hypothetical protein
MPKDNSNNGTSDLFDDLLNGRKTVEEVKAELAESVPFLRAGNNYRRLKFNGLARIEGVAAKVYIAEDKIDSSGKRVEPKPRTPKIGASAKRK